MDIAYPERLTAKYDDFSLLDNLMHKKMSTGLAYQRALVQITKSTNWGDFLFGSFAKVINAVRFALDQLSSQSSYEYAKTAKLDKRYFGYEIQSTIIYFIGEFTVKNSNYIEFRESIMNASEKVITLLSKNSKVILKIGSELIELANSGFLTDKKVCRIIFSTLRNNNLL